jgi:hypothetical protein
MSNNLTAAKAANTAYFDSTKGPSTITADQHAVLLNSTLDTAWNVPLIYEIGAVGDGAISFNDEDPLSVTAISVGGADLYGRLGAYGAPGLFRTGFTLVEFEDGASVTYYREYPGGPLSALDSHGTPAFVIGQRVRVSKSYDQPQGYSGTIFVQDAQFTVGTPQLFTANTRSLLRNDGLGISSQGGYVDGTVLWDLNKLTIGSVPRFFHEVQTQFTIVPSTPDIALEFEWYHTSGLTPTVKKSIYAKGDPIYICETFKIYPWSGNHSIYLTGNKKFDVHSCAHTITINREG